MKYCVEERTESNLFVHIWHDVLTRFQWKPQFNSLVTKPRTLVCQKMNMMFSMYNVVDLNLAGCEIIYNVDFLQVMYMLVYQICQTAPPCRLPLWSDLFLLWPISRSSYAGGMILESPLSLFTSVLETSPPWKHLIVVTAVLCVLGSHVRFVGSVDV